MNDKTMPAPAADANEKLATLGSGAERGDETSAILTAEGGDTQLPPDYKYIISTSGDYILAQVYVVSKDKSLQWEDGSSWEKPGRDTEYWWSSKEGWLDLSLSTIREIKIEVLPYDYNVRQKLPWGNTSSTFCSLAGRDEEWSRDPKSYKPLDSYYYSSVDADIFLQLVSKDDPSFNYKRTCAGVQWWVRMPKHFDGSLRGVLKLDKGITTLTKASGPPDPSKYVTKFSL